MKENEPKKKNGKKKWKRVVKKIILILIILAILAAAGFIAYRKLKAEYTVTYKSYEASIGTISNALSFSGSLQLIDNQTYTAESDATVRNVYVAIGDTVKKGQKLLRLSDGQTVEADFDGRVNKLPVEKDDSVTMGTSLVQVADFSHLRVSVRVDEYDINDVNIGDACVITTTASEKVYNSVIDTIDYISSSGGSVAYYTGTVYVDVDEQDGVYPGMQVTVSIPQEEAKDVVVLKMDALSFDKDNSAYVWMYDENEELVQVPVTVGVSNGNYVEIKEGLNSGDTVYVEVEETTGSGGLLSGLFGGTNMIGGGAGGFSPDSMGGFGDFDPGNMPSMDSGNFNPGSFGGGGSSGSGSSGGSGGGPGGFPGGGGSR